MTHDERWQQQYDQVMEFMNINQRRPSKHRIEEHLMLNWLKHNKKLAANGKMPLQRHEKFMELMEVADKYKRLNQYG
ncbi:MAG: hypothetical protein IJ546_08760 [Prevotella sp.]|nr:hypothetical protein [Prevotella sp.]